MHLKPAWMCLTGHTAPYCRDFSQQIKSRRNLKAELFLNPICGFEWRKNFFEYNKWKLNNVSCQLQTVQEGALPQFCTGTCLLIYIFRIISPCRAAGQRQLHTSQADQREEFSWPELMTRVITYQVTASKSVLPHLICCGLQRWMVKQLSCWVIRPPPTNPLVLWYKTMEAI